MHDPVVVAAEHKKTIQLAALETAKDAALAAQDLDKWVALKGELAALENSTTDTADAEILSIELFPPPLVVNACDDVIKSKGDTPAGSPVKPGGRHVDEESFSEVPEQPLSGGNTTFCPECHKSRIPQWATPKSSAHRIDYCLQRSPTRAFREYFSALKAHTSYFWERDVIQFIMETVRDSEEGQANIEEGQATIGEEWQTHLEKGQTTSKDGGQTNIGSVPDRNERHSTFGHPLTTDDGYVAPLATEVLAAKIESRDKFDELLPKTGKEAADSVHSFVSSNRAEEEDTPPACHLRL
jgi:hypothetical protein